MDRPIGTDQSNTRENEGASRAAYDIVALAASAGGFKALMQFVANLPTDFPAAIVIVQHLDPHHRSLMAELPSNRSKLRVKQAQEGKAIENGVVYVAVPDRHLLVNSDHTISLPQTELVHFVRPSADLMLESVADSYKARAIAVVLTGSGSDGAMGVRAIKKEVAYRPVGRAARDQFVFWTCMSCR